LFRCEKLICLAVPTQYSSDPRILFFIARVYHVGSIGSISNTVTGGVRDSFFNKRYSFMVGDATVIQCFITSFLPPTVTWLKDGVPVNDIPTNTVGSDGGLSTTLSFPFEERDAGVYQCVFTDTSRSEVFIAEPIRLDTGKRSLSQALPYSLCLTCCC
jgi:hypothetical protein